MGLDNSGTVFYIKNSVGDNINHIYLKSNKMDKEEIFYRYRDQCFAAPVDEFGESVGRGELKLFCDEYIVEKRTDKSVLLRLWYGNGGFKGTKARWMRLEARNVFAASTKEKALYHFIKRKERQAGIYKSRLDTAMEAKCLALNLI